MAENWALSSSIPNLCSEIIATTKRQTLTTCRSKSTEISYINVSTHSLERLLLFLKAVSGLDRPKRTHTRVQDSIMKPLMPLRCITLTPIVDVVSRVGHWYARRFSNTLLSCPLVFVYHRYHPRAPPRPALGSMSYQSYEPPAELRARTSARTLVSQEVPGRYCPCFFLCPGPCRGEPDVVFNLIRLQFRAAF